MGIRDSRDLAWQDWQGSAQFDDPDDQDLWGRCWAEAYVDWAAGGKRRYLYDLGLWLVPLVGWAERGDGSASGHGNSVPRFHITWGTGPRVVEVFAEPVLRAEDAGLVRFAFRHRVDEMLTEGGAVVGVRARCSRRTTPRAASPVPASRWASSRSVRTRSWWRPVASDTTSN